MRKLFLSLAAAGTALVFASPAAAQYYPQQQQAYGYGAPQYAYGYNSYGGQNLVMRVDALQRRIAGLERAHILRGDRAERLRHEAHDLQRRIRQASAYGYGGFGQGDVQQRLARLEQRVNMVASYGRGYGYNNGYGGYGHNNGYGGYGYNSGYANGYGQQAYGDRDRDDDDRYDAARNDQDDDD